MKRVAIPGMDWKTLTLRELIALSDGSTRLKNASQMSAVFETAIGDFLATRQEVLDRLDRTRNVGRTTIAELELLVDDYAASAPDDQSPEPRAPVPSARAEVLLLDDLPTEIVRVTLKSLVEEVGASARLASAARREAFFAATDVRSFLVEHRATLPKLPNLGRTSAKELADLVDDYLAGAKEVLEEITSAPDQRPDRPRVTADTVAAALAAIFQSLATRRFAPAGAIDLLPPSDGALAAVAALPKNSAFVIRRRYGLESFMPMTLNEIALEAAVTRERVRQVEAKSLKRLNEGAGAVFTRLLDENAAVIGRALSGGRHVITPASISANRGQLEPLHRLAMDVVFGGAEAWAASRSKTTAEGWSRDDVELPSDVVERVRVALTELALPRPLADVSVACSASSEVTAAVLAESLQTKCLDGFVHAGFVGARARRAAMLYRLATQGDSTALFDIQTLAQMHRNACPDDVVASRMVLKEVQEHAHLFVRAFDSLWLSLPLGRDERKLTSVSTLPFEHSHVLDDGSFDDGAIGRALVQCLRDSGPRRLADLRDLVLASGDGSISSVGPILLANPCFQRVLPGTYGLYCEYSEAQIRATISSAQCRHYAFARFGGAPVDYFPLWSRAYEQALCGWARFQAPTDIFRSLLSVASPNDWSLPARQLDEWLELKARYGAWAIGWARREQMTGELPAPETFVSILAHVVLLGSTCWYGVNRSAQQKLDSQQAADVLALMIAAGLVKAPSDWQGPHVGEPSAAAALEAVAHERWRAGRLDWHTGSLADIVKRARERSGDVDLGWLGNGELATVLRGIEAGGFAREPREGTEKEEEEQEDRLGSLLQSDQWAKLFED